MNALAAYQTQTPKAATFSSSMFNDFVAFIDRGQRTTQTYLTNLRQFAAWLKYTGIVNPIRNDIINYRAWLLSEHEGIALNPDSVNGWTYRTGRNGNPEVKLQA